MFRLRRPEGVRRAIAVAWFDAVVVLQISECFNWDRFQLACLHPQGFIMASLLLVYAERGGQGFSGRRCITW